MDIGLSNKKHTNQVAKYVKLGDSGSQKDEILAAAVNDYFASQVIESHT